MQQVFPFFCLFMSDEFSIQREPEKSFSWEFLMKNWIKFAIDFDKTIKKIFLWRRKLKGKFSKELKINHDKSFNEFVDEIFCDFKYVWFEWKVCPR